MEQLFQTDFSDVRVHVGPRAARLNARAFTFGSQLHFAPSYYQPDTLAGQWLLAHELAHVVQQRAGRAVNPLGKGVALVNDPLLEAEADTWAARAVLGVHGRLPTGDSHANDLRDAHRTAEPLIDADWKDLPTGVIQCDDDDDLFDAYNGGDNVPVVKWPNVISRHRTAKTVSTRSSTLTSVGMFAGSTVAAGLGVKGISLGAAVIGGAALSATGIGLVAVSGALTVGTMALGAKSAYSTYNHLKRLEELYKHRDRYRHTCNPLAGSGEIPENIHDWVSETILPWIIHQKKHKLGKKATTVVPGASLGVGLWSAGRNIYKRIRGTLGKKRSFYAECLAVHLLTSTCGLAEAIVSELYSEEEMCVISGMSSEAAAPLIAEKMKSV